MVQSWNGVNRLILTKAPLRVSFIGGGTDYQPFIESHGGLVVAASIDKSVYVNVLKLPEFAREKFRFTYRITESVNNLSEFLHPSVRETLKALDWQMPLNISTMADVPGSSGLGSSSAFVVALKLALDNISSNKISSPKELAEFAIDVERVRLKEPGGIQDQFEAAYGGFRAYKFDKSDCETKNFDLSHEDLRKLSEYFSLISVIGERISPLHAINTSHAKTEHLIEMLKEAKFVVAGLENAQSIEEIAKVLHAAIASDWEIKQNFSSGIVEEATQNAIRVAKHCGIRSIKLCGAGGSGFLLAGHEPGARVRLAKNFPKGHVMSPNFGESGAQLLFQ